VAAVPALGKALKDSQVEVRRAAAGALMKMGTDAKTALGSLQEALKDRDKFVRCQAIRTLGGLGKDAESAIPAMAQCLGDDVAEVRLCAVEELGRLGPLAQSTLPLLKMAQQRDNRATIRQAAGEAIKKIEMPFNNTPAQSSSSPDSVSISNLSPELNWTLIYYHELAIRLKLF
jgi:HEAT repeat protein